MGYRYLDMDTYKRKEHFDYFNSLTYPYCGITVNVDITDLLKKVKAEHIPFFHTICYCASKAANGVPEFRQRIFNGRIIEFDRCKTSYTVALENETFCYCELEDDMPFGEYLAYAARMQEEAKRKHTIEEEEDKVYEKFFVSTLPWVSYTAIVQPVPVPADSNPRITWGRYFEQGGRTFLPVSVLCHHALVDGVHLARFYELLEAQFLLVSGN